MKNNIKVTTCTLLSRNLTLSYIPKVEKNYHDPMVWRIIDRSEKTHEIHVHFLESLNKYDHVRVHEYFTLNAVTR